MRRSSWIAITGLTCALAGCSSGGDPQASLSTASILGEAPPAARGDAPGISRADPMARPVQVAWTSARAQKCGFNFDPAKLRANYLTWEQGSGADATRMANVTKTYDMTVEKIKSTIGNADIYCSDKKSSDIKADLTRHLAGNFEPNFPEEKRTSAFGAWGDTTNQDRFDPKTIWQDLEDKKNGVRTAN